LAQAMGQVKPAGMDTVHDILGQTSRRSRPEKASNIEDLHVRFVFVGQLLTNELPTDSSPHLDMKVDSSRIVLCIPDSITKLLTDSTEANPTRFQTAVLALRTLTSIIITVRGSGGNCRSIVQNTRLASTAFVCGRLALNRLEPTVSVSTVSVSRRLRQSVPSDLRLI
jgi:hypothetical protein